MGVFEEVAIDLANDVGSPKSILLACSTIRWSSF